MTLCGSTIFGNYVANTFIKVFQRLSCNMHRNLQQEEQSEFNMGLANSRVPPTWSVEGDRRYPLRNYVQDVNLWAAATDLDEERRGPAAALRLTGAARAIVREMPTDLLRNGQRIPDGQGGMILLTGLDCLLRMLQRRYGALDQETQIFAVSELMQFTRLGHESSDEVLARYEVICHRAEQVANVAFPVLIKSWMVLTMLRIPRSSWPLLLAPTLGSLPLDEAQYNAMIQYVRRNSHLFESTGDRQKSIQQPFLATSNADAAQAFWFSESPQSYYTDPTDYSYNAFTETENWTAFPAYSSDDDQISWHSYSTGKSAENDEDLTWDDLPSLDPNEQSEFLYLNYRFAKRRFRKVGFKRTRFTGRFKGKGKGKGKGFGGGKGKGKGKGFGKAGTGSHSVPGFWIDYPDDSTGTPWTNESEWTETEVYFKGGKGKGDSRKGNPMGKDGRQMKCSTCGSTDHFWKQCTQQGKGKGKSTGQTGSTFVSTAYPAYPFTSSASASTTSASPPCASSSSFNNPQPLTRPAPAYTFLANATAQDSQASVITFSDGRPSLKLFLEEGQDDVDQHLFYNAPANALMRTLFSVSESDEPSFKPSSDHSFVFPTWSQHEDDDAIQLSYHSRVKLEHGESLLVDTGCIDALAGSEFIARVSECARKAGHGTEFRQLKRTLTVEGVGQGSNSCTREAQLPIAMEDGLTSMHTTSEVPNSSLPGLIGLKVMERRHVVLDLVHKQYIEVGPGGFQLHLPPGSRVLKMHLAPTGHLMLPITEWNKACKVDKQAFVQTADR